MLHILLLILKIIGIILAVIVGIIILLLSIILFVPIRYEISAKCDGTIDSLKAKLKATWLLHLLRADVLVKGEKIKWQVRAAWIKKTSAMVLGGRKDEGSDESEKTESGEDSQKVEEGSFESKTCEETTGKCEDYSEKIEERRLEEDSQESAEEPESTSGENEKESVGQKIKGKYEKVKVLILDLIEKKEKICDLLTQEPHVRAFKKLKKELFVLLRNLKPKKVHIKARFGFEDPGMTGKVLGGISMLYPLFEDSIEIIPDFEKQILKGSVFIKGRIRFCHIAVLAVKLLLCKDIRTSYKDIKNFKL